MSKHIEQSKKICAEYMDGKRPYFDSLNRALIRARVRTGDYELSTCAAKGKTQVCRVTYPKGPRSVVVNVGEAMDREAAVAFLNTL